MMATAKPPSASSLLPLLESLEDGAAGQSEHTDAYLTIANRLSGEEARQFLPAVEKHFSRLGQTILTHMSSPTVELSQAALQALGFCLYHSHVVSGVPETFAAEIFSALCSLVVKSTDKNTCTRALWVISTQSFPPNVVGKKVSSILGTLESVWSREDIQSVVMEHEALNVIIRMLEQAPAQMGDGTLRWAKLVIPLVVHSASKVRLRAAAAMEMGMPLLLEKQMEVAGIIEPMMSSKLIPELQKLFMSKNETNVLKLWPLFVKLLGKLLHRGGPFINSLLHLEELGFRSPSPAIKKIAFIAWKSLIDNFALNPDILCSAKRMKLLMQPLASINVRMEALLLTKVEVWWYLVVQLGPNLSAHFDQVSVPLLQCTIGSDSSSVLGTPSRSVSQNGAITPGVPKTAGFSSPAPRLSLNSSVQMASTFPSIQLLGLEMLLHYFLGPEVSATAAKKKLILSLEPLNHPLLSGASSFTKHAAVLTSNVRDGFIHIGKDAPDALLAVIWTSLVRFVNLTIESGSKKDRHGGEVLTLMLQALQSIVASEALPADKVLIVFEATVKGIPQRVLGSASYQVGKMDVLNGTPALFLILLLYNSSMLSAFIQDDRFLQCLQTLVGCGLSGPTSPLAFGEAVLGAIRRSAASVQNKEQLWRMWSVMVSPLTDTITQSNEVNQGDALEHNFSAVHSALLFPITHLLPGAALQQAAQRSMLSSWSKLYKVFARCSALVVTAEENVCCEELCAKMAAAVDREALRVPSTLNAVSSILQVMVECVDFSPYTPQFQQKLKSPHTPVNWMRKRNKVLGNLSTFQSLLVHCLEVYLEASEAPSEATGLALVSILSALFTNLALANTVKEALTSLVRPLTVLCRQAASEPTRFSSQLLGKLEKLLADVLGCLQTRSTLAYDDELLALLAPLLCVMFPHKNKQLRAAVVQFWNATFAKSVRLAYPDEIRPILSQVKQKTPIILPGFEVVSVPDELSGPYSSESSQMETKLSGMPVSVGKKDPLLGKAAEPKAWSSKTTSKSVSTKLDFGSPKPPSRGVLEEEASIDFVFIPPETKERVLTEHQKEVKRTKRVDIPAMYNNLDASLDSTVFTQYTQSQEDSLDKLATQRAEDTKEAPGKVPQDDVGKDEDVVDLTEETQDYASPKADENTSKNHEQDDVSMEDDAKSDDRAGDSDLQNVSASSDLVSGTPQKPNSRRQSFITLEKYAEGKPASPSSASKFTGLLIKTSNSQEHSKTKKSSSQTGTVNSPCPLDSVLDSPVRPKDSGARSEPVKLTERLPSDPADEDVIPDTQSEVENKQNTSSSQDEDSDQTPDDSQSSGTQISPNKSRRPGRPRIRPLLPGEDPEEREEKNTPVKRRRSGEEPKSDESRRVTRSTLAAEEHSPKDRLRSRTQRDKTESSQTNSLTRSHKKIRLFSSSQNFLDNPEPRRRSSRESSQSDRGSKASPETRDESGVKKKDSPDKEESNQTAKHEPARKTGEDDGQTNPSSQPGGQSQEVQTVEQTRKDGDEIKNDSQVITSSPQPGGQSQEVQIVEQTSSQMLTSPQTGVQSQEFIEKTEDAQIVTSSQTGVPSEDVELVEKTDSQMVCPSTNDESQRGPGTTEKLENESEAKDNLGQEDSQSIPASSSDSQARRRSSRSKAAPEVAESKDKSERQTRSNSQTAVGQPEARPRGRPRRIKVQEDQSEGSQSLDTAGSDESSRGRGRYPSRRSSPASLVAAAESSESESLAAKDNPPTLKKRGRKPRASLPSPLTVQSKDGKTNKVTDESDASQEAESQSSEDSQKTQDLIQINTEGQSRDESPMEVDAVEQKTENTKSESVSVSPRREEENQTDSNIDEKPAEDSDSHPDVPVEDATEDVEHPDVPVEDATEDVEHPDVPVEDATEDVEHPDVPVEDATEDVEHPDVPVEDATEDVEHPDVPVEDATEDVEHPDVPVEDTTEDVEHPDVPVEDATEDVEHPDVPVEDATEDVEHPDVPVEDATEDVEHPDVPVEDTTEDVEHPDVIDDVSKEEEESTNQQPEVIEVSAGDDVAPPQESDKGTQTAAFKDEDQTNTETNVVSGLDAALAEASVLSESTSKDVSTDSPAKQRDLEALMGADVGQSPSSGKTRGTWSPSASPSTSILKRGLKRALEEESPSPLVKSRRVSFANPIQHQEIADDIDRRSPALRTSSPRRSKVSSIPQPKFVTTPTKGLLILSPRNLHSPGYKSSKKCLISELSQEPRPVSRDCIYPALVGCSTPVEAVLPQISSNMWSRGLGQLVRARNIKTVGDLSALSAGEIKTLPIRSPKISNVKKALKVYEQQRKGRGGDELKSLDEMEMMTAELEETSTPQNQDQNQDQDQDEEEKTSAETLATELLVDESVPADGRPDSGNQTPDTPSDGPLQSEVEALSGRMTPLELSYCSPQQLVQMHEQLGGLMRRVVVELQTRLGPADGRP